MFGWGKGKKAECNLAGRKYEIFPYEDLKEKSVGSSTINLNRNNIREIPQKQFFELATSTWRYSVTKLSICDNKLCLFPREISLLVNLKALLLDNNLLSFIPSDIVRLRTLEKLSIKNNKLTKLPEEFSALVNLKELNFANNLVKRIPRSLAKLDRLEDVVWKGNPISYPPPHVIDRGRDVLASAPSDWQTIREYLMDPIAFVRANYSDEIREKIKSNTHAELGSAGMTSGAVSELSKKVKVLLSNKVGRKAFAAFLEKEFSLENLLFYEEVETLNVHSQFIDEEDYKVQAHKIFEKFIKRPEINEDDPTFDPLAQVIPEINLPFEIKDKCVQFFEGSRFGRGAASYKEMLELASRNIFQLLALDSYSRFATSPEWEHAKSQIPPDVMKVLGA